MVIHVLPFQIFSNRIQLLTKLINLFELLLCGLLILAYVMLFRHITHVDSEVDACVAAARTTVARGSSFNGILTLLTLEKRSTNKETIFF